jgi:UDP-glucose 4-epimerase
MTSAGLQLVRERLSGTDCVVTGGLGFIGSNLALTLADAGATVTVVDDLKAGHGGDRANVDDKQVAVIVADVGDPAHVAPAVAAADYVFDLAGQVSHVASISDPERDLALNTISRLRFLETLKRVGSRARVVYTSTRQVYGRSAPLPISERTVPHPSDVNGVAKLAAEHLHLLYARERTAILRLSNVYGPRQHLRNDELGVLPVFVRRALRGERLVVFGDGRDLRDPLHVDDVLDAIIRAALVPEAAGQVINVGHHEVLSIKQLAELTAAASSSSPTVVHDDWRSDYAQVAIGSAHLSSSLASTLLGWQPRIGFADGIDRTLAWFSQHPERFA